jgi:hypothetical protein
MGNQNAQLTTPLPLPNHGIKPRIVGSIAIPHEALAEKMKLGGILMDITVNGLVHTATGQIVGGSLSHTGGGVALEVYYIAGGCRS